MFIYIASFEYGKAYLMRAILVKETEKTFSIEPNSIEAVFGRQRYIPNRLDKGLYNVFTSVDDALNFLADKCRQHILGLKQDTLLAQAELMYIIEVMK